MNKLTLASVLTLGTMIAPVNLSHGAVSDRPFFQSLGTVILWGTNNFSEGNGDAPIVADFVLLNGVASGAEGNDLIGANLGTVATGSLTPLSRDAPTIQDGISGPLINEFISGQTFGGELTDNSPTGLLNAADTLSPFGLDDATDIGSQANRHNASFYVASNTPFDINGELINPVATGDFSINFTLANITYDMAVTVAGDDSIIFGTSAQDPSIGGIGPLPTLTTLADFGGGVGEIQVYDGGRRTAATPGTLAEQSVRFDLTYALDGDVNEAGIQPFDFSSGNGTISMFMVYTVFAP